MPNLFPIDVPCSRLADPTAGSIVFLHVIVDRLRVCMVAVWPWSISNHNYVCCSRHPRTKAHGIRLHRASGLEVLRSSIHMECLLVRVLFAVSTKSEGRLESQNPLTSIPSLRQFPLYSKTEPPAVLKEHFKDDTFKKSQKYGKDKAKFSLYSGLFKQVLDSALLHYGVYAWSWDVAGSIRLALGYGPEHEVSSMVYSCRMSLICSGSIDHSVAPLRCYLVLRLLYSEYPALGLSNFRSRGKARV